MQKICNFAPNIQAYTCHFVYKIHKTLDAKQLLSANGLETTKYGILLEALIKSRDTRGGNTGGL
jgi:hypothetical protein